MIDNESPPGSWEDHIESTGRFRRMGDVDGAMREAEAEITRLNELNCALQVEAQEQDRTIAALKVEVERLRHVCGWAAGRLLDAGDVNGHERMIAMRGEGE